MDKELVIKEIDELVFFRYYLNTLSEGSPQGLTWSEMLMAEFDGYIKERGTGWYGPDGGKRYITGPAFRIIDEEGDTIVDWSDHVDPNNSKSWTLARYKAEITREIKRRRSRL